MRFLTYNLQLTTDHFSPMRRGGFTPLKNQKTGTHSTFTLLRRQSFLNGKRKSGNFLTGFTLLFAVLVGSLLFSMGVAVANLALKELAFSSAGKSSEIAFYTADAGVECALYWDLREVGTFPNSETAESRSEITCNENTIPVTVDQKTATAAVSNFTMAFGSGCAAVTVIKTKPQGKTAGTVVIESRGRNDCGTENNPARVERALRARY